MKLRNLFDRIFASSMTSTAQPRRLSERKPWHGHEDRAVRRYLTRSNVAPRPHRLHGDPATTGRAETASQRKKRRRGESRARAQMLPENAPAEVRTLLDDLRMNRAHQHRWLNSRVAPLGRTPAEHIRAGRTAEVVALLHAVAEGVTT